MNPCREIPVQITMASFTIQYVHLFHGMVSVGFKALTLASVNAILYRSNETEPPNHIV